MSIGTRKSETWTWGKPTFYYNHGLSGLGATYADADHPVSNILNRLENNYWLSTDFGDDNDIYFDIGEGHHYKADYLAINGHNFYSADVDCSLEYSNANDLSNPANSGTEIATISAPTYDYKPLIVEFARSQGRYWRLRLTPSGSVYPRMVNCYWGMKTELDWSMSSFDPDQSTYDSVVNVGQTGKVLGIHNKQRIRRLAFNISSAENYVYARLNHCFETVGFEPFFACWNYDAYPTRCYYMRFDSGELNAPYIIGTSHLRNISVNLIGRGSAWR